MVKEGTEIELKSVDFELEILGIFNLNLVKISGLGLIRVYSQESIKIN